MKKIKILHVVMILLAVLALTSIAADGGRKFTTTMTGAAEVLGGDPDGSGTAMLELNPGTGQVCFELSVTGITLPATGAHIHAAPVGVNGLIVVPLTPPDASGSSSGCVSADRDLIKAIIQNPEQYYVNVHNTDYPAGALRGQLSK
jgi:hypothetical protein